MLIMHIDFCNLSAVKPSRASVIVLPFMRQFWRLPISLLWALRDDTEGLVQHKCHHLGKALGYQSFISPAETHPCMDGTVLTNRQTHLLPFL